MATPAATMNQKVARTRERRPQRVALVLPGGAARGAYEVGVLRYLLESARREMGPGLPFDIVCGTSIGAVHGTLLAAEADDPDRALRALTDRWRGLRLEGVLRPSVVRWLSAMVGCSLATRRPTGLFDRAPLESWVKGDIRFDQIDRQIRSGRISAVTVSTTHVASGRTVVFVQRARPQLDGLRSDAIFQMRATSLGAKHVMASASIPLLFPAVSIDGQFYCEGGLRQNVPLAPALRLGATALVVISPHYRGDARPDVERKRERAYASPIFLLGKSLNALLLDRVDADVDRMEQVNAILSAGRRQFGARFVDQINRALESENEHRLRPVETVVVRASESIGALSAAYTRSKRFAARTGGAVARLMAALSEHTEGPEADLLSYLLFDGDFASDLIDLGYQDAKAQHHALSAVLHIARAA